MRILLNRDQINVIHQALLVAGGDDANGVRIHIEDAVARFNDPDRNKYLKAAQESHHKDGETEIDDDALVSMGFDSGAYVEAWIWIRKEDAGVEDKGPSPSNPPTNQDDGSRIRRPLIIE